MLQCFQSCCPKMISCAKASWLQSFTTFELAAKSLAGKTTLVQTNICSTWILSHGCLSNITQEASLRTCSSNLQMPLSMAQHHTTSVHWILHSVHGNTKNSLKFQAGRRDKKDTPPGTAIVNGVFVALTRDALWFHNCPLPLHPYQTHHQHCPLVHFPPFLLSSSLYPKEGVQVGACSTSPPSCHACHHTLSSPQVFLTSHHLHIPIRLQDVTLKHKRTRATRRLLILLLPPNPPSVSFPPSSSHRVY